MVWERILVRGTNWLGDAVMSVPAVRALRGRFPAAHIAVSARARVADVYRRESAVSEVLVEPGGRVGLLRFAGVLRKQRFEAAIVLPNSFGTALAVRMAGIPRRIGYDRDGRGFLLTDAVARPRPGEIPAHERYYYLELLRRSGVIAELPAEEPLVLDGVDAARCAGAAAFRAMGIAGPVVGVSPGAQNSRAKQWLPERFVESAVAVARETGGAVALFGSAAERVLCQRMAEAIRRADVPVLNLAGETTVASFIELAAACEVFLTNDSGAMHVASALAVPTVAVFGPTEFFATAPAGPRSVIVREPVDCSPCMLRDCPIDHRCMTAVPAKRVAETALELLK